LTQPNQHLKFAHEIALKAGQVMLEYFQIGVPFESKADNSPLTAADLAINQLVLEAVQSAYPRASFIGEEGSRVRPDAEYTWVCDPIDGTIPFTLGVPASLFSLALVQDGQPVVAILYDPYLQRSYEAIHNKGAFINGEPLHVSHTDHLTNQRLALPNSNDASVEAGTLIAEAMERYNSSLLAIGSATYESALVATGQIVGAIYPWTSPWDMAAVKLIVEEAGGKVTDLRGHEQRYDGEINGAIVSNGRVHEQMVELVKPHLKLPV